MAKIDQVKEKIKLYTETFRLLWITVLTVGGGSVGLLLGETTLKEVVVCISGGCFSRRIRRDSTANLSVYSRRNQQS